MAKFKESIEKKLAAPEEENSGTQGWVLHIQCRQHTWSYAMGQLHRYMHAL